MKKLLLLVVILLSGVILAWGFIGNDHKYLKTDYSLNTIEPDSLIEQNWTLIKLNGNDDVKEKAGKDIPYLGFHSNFLSGHTGCNEVYGKTIITEDEITFSEVTTTKMMCRNAKFNNYEQQIKELIFYKKPLKYKIEDGILTIFKEGVEVMVLEKAN